MFCYTAASPMMNLTSSSTERARSRAMVCRLVSAGGGCVREQPARAGVVLRRRCLACCVSWRSCGVRLGLRWCSPHGETLSAAFCDRCRAPARGAPARASLDRRRAPRSHGGGDPPPRPCRRASAAAPGGPDAKLGLAVDPHCAPPGGGPRVADDYCESEGSDPGRLELPDGQQEMVRRCAPPWTRRRRSWGCSCTAAPSPSAVACSRRSTPSWTRGSRASAAPPRSRARSSATSRPPVARRRPAWYAADAELPAAYSPTGPCPRLPCTFGAWALDLETGNSHQRIGQTGNLLRFRVRLSEYDNFGRIEPGRQGCFLV